MATKISITASPKLQVEAASFLSQYLTKEFKCPHAYIGGFAWSLLGSERPTQMNERPQLVVQELTFGAIHDVDILIETGELEMLELRKELEIIDKRFASAGFKFYFVHEPAEGLWGESLVRASRDNVLIETLKTGTLGLPSVAEPIHIVKHPSGYSLPILAPPVLILTKMKRWYTSHESTRPKTITKARSDEGDLDFLIDWLFLNDMKIDFNLYEGKGKPELLKVVQAYRDHRLRHGHDIELMEALQGILHEEDWNAIQGSTTTPEAGT